MNHSHFGPVIPYCCVHKNANTFYATEFYLKGTQEKKKEIVFQLMSVFKQNLNIKFLFTFYVMLLYI